jgi:hypothetical protein
MKYSSTQSDFFREPSLETSRQMPATLARLWSRTSKLKEVWVVVQAIGAWPGVAITPDGDGLRLMLRDFEFGFIGWDARLDLPFAPDVAHRLVAEGMASQAPGPRSAGHVVFDIRTLIDSDRAVWLLRLAYQSACSNAKRVNADSASLS